MPQTFYHVDRFHDLAAGQTIDREPAEEWDPAVNAYLRGFHGGGLTNHGAHYASLDLYDADDVALWDVTCELVFELVRARRFADRPSRFQSVFAFETERDAHRFAREWNADEYAVWRVTGERAFRGDMRLVDARDYARTLRRAHTYWQGRSVSDDPLWEVLLEPPVDVDEPV